MRSLRALLLAVLALPGSAYAWGTHANPDDLLDLNSQYNRFLSALEVLNLPVDQVKANRTRELLGLGNNEPMIRGWQRHGGGDLHEPVHFTLTVAQTVDDSADNGYPKQVSEVATLDLKHTPESVTPFVYTVVPLQPIREPAKPKKNL